MPNFMEHVGNIAKNTKLSSIAETMASKFADFILSGTDEELITLDVCVKLAKQEREKNPAIKNFLLTINYDEAFNAGDNNVTLRLGFLDVDMQPVIISDKGENGYIFRTKTKNIDENILALLNGKPSVTVQM